MHSLQNVTVAVIGLGYVGLPLAIEFGKKYPTLGFDINETRISQLRKGTDITQEVDTAELQLAKHLSFTADPQPLFEANVYIVTVPTPVDLHRRPDLTPLRKASTLIGNNLKKNNVVIYESTVYPGATEEVCAPLLEQHSGLKFNEDFFVGYSPERINPGDKLHRLTNIQKITSGSTPQSAEFVDMLYNSIIQAGTYRASSIKVAEAAKVIENTQRDLNIALVNELAILFNKLNIDTHEVLNASGTKWNFLPFKPGLVGGHCISVDPYYLTHKAQEVGYHPEVILAGRRINDGMGAYVAERLIKIMTQRKIHVVNSRILILGLTFKENCPDLRNSRVIDVIKEFAAYHAQVDVYDPWVDKEEARSEYDVELCTELTNNVYDAIVLCVAHNEFIQMGINKIKALGKDECVIFDVKSVLPKDSVDGRL